MEILKMPRKYKVSEGTVNLNGWAQASRPRGRSLGRRSPLALCRVQGAAAPSTPEVTLSEPRRLEVRREGGGNGVQVRVGGGWGDGEAVSPGAGRIECFFPLSLPFVSLFW